MTLAVLPLHIQPGLRSGAAAAAASVGGGGDGCRSHRRRHTTCFSTHDGDIYICAREGDGMTPDGLERSRVQGSNNNNNISDNSKGININKNDNNRRRKSLNDDKFPSRLLGPPVDCMAGRPADGVTRSESEDERNLINGITKRRPGNMADDAIHNGSQPEAKITMTTIKSIAECSRSTDDASCPVRVTDEASDRGHKETVGERVTCLQAKSLLNIPNVDETRGSRGTWGASTSAHQYTPYFYVPQRTTYENDQDVSIIDQCLEDVFLRANYFELKQLASAGFDFTKSDDQGNTALHYAAIRGEANIVKLILQEGGSVWARNRDRQTPFELASNLSTAMMLADSTLFYSEQKMDSYLEKTTVCYEL